MYSKLASLSMTKIFLKQLLLLVSGLLHIILHCSYAGGKTVVVSESGTDNETVCFSGVALCRNLTMALESIASNTTIVIMDGTYTLQRSAKHKFNKIKNVSISGHGEVTVNCSDGAGLTFLQTTAVKISNVSFYGCGYEHVSNSIVKRKDEFAQYKVALFFQMCENVSLNRVNVSYSKGIAVQFFATIGNNEISWSNFIKNTGGQTIGGGVYIEFPYCLPGNLSQCTINASTVPEKFTSGGTFHITYSNFSYNDAHPPKNESRVFMVPHLEDHISFGRGGGLSVFFKGNSNNSSVTVSHCQFISNKAIFGGGAFVDFEDNCHDNKISFENCRFESNQAVQQGGGLRLTFSTSITSTNDGFKGSDMHHNHILVVANLFLENLAFDGSGGGMFFGYVRENSTIPTNVLFMSGNWTKNIAPVGFAISMISWHEVTHGGVVIRPEIGECIFNYHPHIARGTHEQLSVGKGTVYLDSIPLQFSNTTKFIHNQHTAIVCVNTMLYFKHAVHRFVNNSAYQGGAIALLGNAFLMVNQGIKLEFINNTAYYLGGAIFATSLTGQNSITSGKCLIRYFNLMKDPNEWDVQIKFINNTAMGKPNAIYTSSLLACLWGREFGPPHDDHQDISTVFCWNKNVNDTNKRWDYGNSKCDDEIRSAPSKFEIDNNQTVEVSLDVMPGRWKNLNLTALDDFGHDVSNYAVFAAQSLSSADVTLSNHSRYLAHNSILFLQPNSSVKGGTVVLRTIDTPNPIVAVLNITFMDCPPGFNLKQGQCVCAKENYEYLFNCVTNSTSTYSDVMRGYWIGPSPFDNETIIMAICEFCYYENNTVSVKNFFDVQHNLCHKVNRDGPLCSQCIDNYCIAVNSESYDCVKYNENISTPIRVVIFILYKSLFSILFLWFVYRFGIKIASGKYNAPVFFAQMVTTVSTMDLDGALWYPPTLKKVYFMLYDMLNLELRLPEFGQFCIDRNISITLVIALNYCVAILPLVIVIVMAIVYMCHDMGNKVWCCYFKKDNNETHTRMGSCCSKVFYYINRVLFSTNREYLVSAVAAFFVLSYMKIAVTTCMLITPTKLINGSGSVLYMDGSKRFPNDITPYLILASIFCVYLLMVPISLLILRYSDPSTSEGFLYHLLKGLQENFRSLPLTERYFMYCKDKVRHRGVHRTGMWRKATFNTKTELYSVDFKCCSGSTCFCSCSAHDFRWVSGVYFVLRILMVVIYIVVPTDMIQLVCQMLICSAAAVFFILFQPYGYNHKEQDENRQKNQQEMKNNIQGNSPVCTCIPNSPSKRYNKLDAFLFLALAMVIALSIYRSYRAMFERNSTSISVLTLQSVLLFLPAAWFGYHILLDLKERWSRFRKWVSQRRYKEGEIYEAVPTDDPI